MTPPDNTEETEEQGEANQYEEVEEDADFL